jgi:hypothetical protein
MVHDRPKQFEMAQNDPIWPEMVQIGSKGSEWHKMVRNSLVWPEMIQSSL